MCYNKTVNAEANNAMKEIKATYLISSSHTHCGSHRTSDGFKYKYRDMTQIMGPYFSEPLNISYQDMMEIEHFSSRIKEERYECEEDYEWAESYKPDNSQEIEADLGLCAFFEKNFSKKYDIKLIIGNKAECSLDIEKANPLFGSTKEIILSCYTKRQEDIKNIELQIKQLENQIKQLQSSISDLSSHSGIVSYYYNGLYELAKLNPQNFEVDKPLVNSIYPLDIAVAQKDEALISLLVKRKGCKYSGVLRPILSAQIGEIQHCIALFQKETISDKDIADFFQFLVALPSNEFYSFISDDTNNIFRDGELIASVEDCKFLINGLQRFQHERGYRSPLDKDPGIEFINNLLKDKEFDKANKAYYWLRKKCSYYIDDEKILELSFQYGNMKYLYTFSLWELVHKITEPYSYSYYYKCYQPDRFGNTLKLKWNFERYVSPEYIGIELYNKIIDQIENHSSNYIF